MVVRFVTLVLTIAASLHGAVAELSIESGEKPALTLHGVHAGVRLQFLDDVHPLGIAIADPQGAVNFSIDGLPPGPHAIRAVEWGTGKSVSAPILFTIPARPAGFAASVTYATGIQPVAIISADLNGGGVPDLIVCVTSATGVGSIRRMKNHGGTFSAPVNLAAVAGPVAIAVQDFNGDGRNDLAVASADGRVAILLNGGSEFSRVRYFAAGAHPAALVSADFNGDGIPDLAVTNQDDNTVSILLGNGDGTFQAAVASPAGYSPRGLVAADFNGDGLVDLATANFQGNDLSILLGDGKGGFRNAGNVPAGNGPVDLAVTDFDENGSPDLAVRNQLDGTVMVLGNNGSASFQPLSTLSDVGLGEGSLVVGDIDGDGHADLVLQSGGRVRVRTGRGDGGFAEGYSIAAGTAPWLLTLGDFNGDQRLDVGVVDFGGTLTVLPSEAPSSISTLATTTPFIYIDSLSSGSTVSGTVTVSGWAINSNTAIGPMIGSVQILVDGTVVGAATYGTTRADVCSIYAGRLGCPNVGFTYQLNTAALSPGTHTITALASDTSSPAVTGSYSLAVTVPAAPAPSVFVDSLAPGAAVSGMVTVSGWAINNITGIGAAISGVQVALDGALVGNASYGSTRTDVCTAYPGRAGCPNVGFTYQLNTVVLSSGVHTVTVVATDTSGTTGSYALTIKVGTLGSTTTLQSSLNPATYFQNVTLTATVAPFPGVTFGTVTFENNGTILGTKPLVNGQAVLTTSQLGTGTRSLRAYYSGNATYGSSSSAVLPLTINAASTNGFQPAFNYSGPSPQSVAVADLNGDGKSDLAIAEAGNVILLLGNGDGTFQSGGGYSSGGSATFVAVGDFNGDGKADLAVANTSSGTIGVLLGRGDGTFQAVVTYAVGSLPMSIVVGDFNGDGKPDLAIGNNGSSTVSVLLARGDGTFQAALNYPTENRPASLVVGDFNGDGVADLAVANNGSNSVSVLLGHGDGTFQTVRSYGLGASPTAIASGDFNGDGKSDIVIAGNGSVSVLSGRGDGTFVVTANYSSGNGLSSVVIGDFNGDGKADLAIANAGSNSISVFLGHGDGTFSNTVNSAASQPLSLAVGDFNGDGRADLAAANNSSNTVSILLGVANGPAIVYIDSLASGAVLSGVVVVSGWSIDNTASPGTPIGSVQILVDGAVVGTASYGTPRTDVCAVYPGRPGCPNVGFTYQLNTGLLSAGAHTLTAVATNQDYSLDTVSQSLAVTVVYALTLTSSAPSITFGQPLTLTTKLFNSSAAGNVTFYDGAAVLGTAAMTNGQAMYTTSLLSSGSHSIHAFAGLATSGSLAQNVLSVTATKLQTNGNFTTGNSPYSVAMGDFNGDGKTDMAIANSGSFPLYVGSVSVILGNGDGSFQAPVIYATGTGSSFVAVGDFNGDGKADLAVTNWSGSVSLLLGNGDGTFKPPVIYLVGSTPYSLVVGDFNGDGVADLAVANYGDNTVSVLLGNGDGTLRAAGSYSADAPESIAVGDFNGDGKTDLVLATSAGVAILLGNGNGTFQKPLSYPAGQNPYSVAVGDFNGDGKADLAVANLDSNTVSVLLGNGNGSFQFPVDYTVDANPEYVVVGDFNGDGKLDLATANYGPSSGGGGDAMVLLGRGDGTFQVAATYAAGFNPFFAAVGDFNRDGRSDLAVINVNGGNATVLLGKP